MFLSQIILRKKKKVLAYLFDYISNCPRVILHQFWYQSKFLVLRCMQVKIEAANGNIDSKRIFLIIKMPL